MLEAPSPTSTLLLVDDDRLILFTLGEALRAMGFDVLSVSSGGGYARAGPRAPPIDDLRHSHARHVWSDVGAPSA